MRGERLDRAPIQAHLKSRQDFYSKEMRLNANSGYQGEQYHTIQMVERKKEGNKFMQIGRANMNNDFRKKESKFKKDI